MRVTLNVFGGRPGPVWRPNQATEAAFWCVFGRLPAGAGPAPGEGLGHGDMVVEVTGGGSFTSWMDVVVRRRAVVARYRSGRVLYLADDGLELAGLLLGSAHDAEETPPCGPCRHGAEDDQNPEEPHMIRLKIKTDAFGRDPREEEWLVNPNDVVAVHFRPEVRYADSKVMSPACAVVYLRGLLESTVGGSRTRELIVGDPASVARLLDMER